MANPTIEYRIEDQNRIVTEFRYTPLVCSKFECRYSDGAAIIYLLNPIIENPVCSKCGSKLVWSGEKDFIERFEKKIV